MSDRGNYIDEVKARRALMIFLTLPIVVILSYIALRTGRPLLSLLVVVSPLALVFLSHPARLFILYCWSAAIGLKAPGLEGNVKLEHLFMFGTLVILMAGAAMRVFVPRFKDRQGAVFCVLFALNLVVIMLVRGSGMMMLGGSQAGGSIYILWGFCLLMYLCAGLIEFQEKEVYWLIVGLFLLPLLNPLMEWLTLRSGGAVYPIARYFNISTDFLSLGLTGREQEYRAGTMPIAVFLQMVGLLVFARRQRLVLFLIFAGLGAVVLMFSGFRSFLVGYCVITLASGLVLYRRRFLLVKVCAVGAILGLVVIYTYFESLPFGVQRSLSFLPGLEGVGKAVQDARQSVDWRVDIWRTALAELPKYALIGRGLAWDITSWGWLSDLRWYASSEFYYANHNYHSGPITLLVDYGLSGALLWLFFQIHALRKIWGIRRLCLNRLKEDPICAFYIVFSIQLTWEALAFWLVYGQTLSMQWFLMRVVLIILVSEFLKKKYQIKDERTSY